MAEEGSRRSRGRRRRRGKEKEQTDKIREPLTEVQEKKECWKRSEGLANVTESSYMLGRRILDAFG